MNESIVEVRNLNKIYDSGSHALKGVSLAIRPGEFVAVIGLSGSGKSTFLRCLNRLIDPTDGQVLFKGQDITHLPNKKLRAVRREIGMIFQSFNLLPRTTVMTNVLTGVLSSTPFLKSAVGAFSKADRERALQCLALVGLEGRAQHRSEQLSGGQQQRVAIARALMQEPSVLLADEPVASLDPATSHSVMKYLKRANTELGKTVICNLHFLSLVREYATRAVALKDGKIVYDGDTRSINESLFQQIYGDDAREITIH